MNNKEIYMDSDVPLPERISPKNVLCQMKKGDSFLVKTIKDALRWRSIANYHEIKIVQKKEEKGIRIWRAE